MTDIKFIGGLYLQDVDPDTYVPHLDADSDKFCLHEDFTCVFQGETIVVPKGYYTDLSSVPKMLWWAYPPGLSYGRKPSVVHDYIYSNLYETYTKKFADDLFYAGLIHKGMKPWKAKLCYWAVRAFGRGGWEWL